MSPTKRTCQKCGATLAEDARFCEECGTAVSAQTGGTESSSPVRIHTPGKSTLSLPNVPTPLLIGLGVMVALVCVVLAGIAIVRSLMPPTTPTEAALIPIETQVEVVVDSPTATVSAGMLPTEASAPIDQPKPTALETAPPNPTDTPVPVAPDPQTGLYDFEGVTFSYDPDLAAIIETETVSAQAGDDLPPWELYPEHRVLSFLGYPLSGTFHEPKIIIYPMQEYLEYNPAVGDQVANLQQMLIGKRTDFLPDSLPFFTMWNAGQMMASQIKYLDFKNGSGVRYLTQYGQGIYPIDNQHLFYTFQGLTNDKNWLISAILPVNNSVLPDANTLLSDPDFLDNYAAYLDSAKLLLNELPETSYMPNLALLDALFQSFEIK